MSAGAVVVYLAILSCMGYCAGSLRAVDSARRQGVLRMVSRREHYGIFVALWTFVPGFLLVVSWYALVHWVISLRVGFVFSEPVEGFQWDMLRRDEEFLAGRTTSPAFGTIPLEIAALYAWYFRVAQHVLSAIVFFQSSICFLLSLRAVGPGLHAREKCERFAERILFLSSLLAIFVTVGILLSLFGETVRFFTMVSPWEFFFGLHWSPASITNGSSDAGSFGAVPLFAGTLLITCITICFAVPVGLLSAIYLSDYAGMRCRKIFRPILEILAGIPTVVYGFFAVLIISPLLRGWGHSWGFDVAAESALAAGLVMGMMIIPFICSLSYDAIRAVPQSLREGSEALGATKSETMIKVVFPAASAGIVGAFLLAVSRAIGETMIVVMAAGLAPNLTVSPMEAVTTATVQIVTLLSGDQEFDSPQTLAAFALSFVLFCVTLGFNFIALSMVRTYRKRYD